jgi:hypothetical protein
MRMDPALTSLGCEVRRPDVMAEHGEHRPPGEACRGYRYLRAVATRQETDSDVGDETA